MKLVDGANTVAEYEYDGLGQRIVKSVYASGVLDHRQHVYYNSNWQALEVRKEVGGTEDHQPLEQYVWHPQYIDAPVLRDYDADTDGTAERHYYSYDANYNITAVTDGTGTVLERYHYSPFGELEVLDADFSADADGKSDIENSVTYTGRRFDEESGLYYFRHRYHHPQLGHFTNRDPAGYVDGMSLYQSYFAPGGVDPSGLFGGGSDEMAKSGHSINVPNVGTYELSMRQYDRWQLIQKAKTEWISYGVYVADGVFGGHNPIQSLEDQILLSAVAEKLTRESNFSTCQDTGGLLMKAKELRDAARHIDISEDMNIIMAGASAAVPVFKSLKYAAKFSKRGFLVKGAVRKNLPTKYRGDGGPINSDAYDYEPQIGARENPNILSGHGVHYEKDGFMNLPEGTSLSVWGKYGTELPNSVGANIDMGTLPFQYQLAEIYGAKTYLPGSKVPNFTLKPPGKLRILGWPTLVNEPTLLNNLLKPNMGNVQWGACQVIR